MIYKNITLRSIGLILVCIFLWISVEFFEFNMLTKHFLSLFHHPLALIIMTITYGLSFFLRSYAWYLYMNKKVKYSLCVTALWYSLLTNHISPIKAGDMVRIGFITMKSKKISFDEALHSVIMMRLMDIVTLFLFASIGALYILDHQLQLGDSLVWSLILGSIFIAIIILISKKYFPKYYLKHMQMLLQALSGKRGFIMILLIIISWACEAIVVANVSRILQMDLSFLQSIWVNSLTVGGQVFSVTPGGIATYETIMMFAIVQMGYPLQGAYSIAILSHAFKFLFSYAVGFYALLTSPIQMKNLFTWIKNKGVGAK